MSDHHLMHFRKSEREIVKRLDELAQRTRERGKPHVTEFLSPREAEVGAMMATRNEVEWLTYGGYAGAERVRGMFYPFGYAPVSVTAGLFGIACLEVSVRGKHALRHQDYLGSLLALGIKRSQMGDIIIQNNELTPLPVYVFSNESMASFLIDNYTHAGQLPVVVSRNDGASDYIDFSSKLEEKVFTLKSLRLDALVAHAFGISRNQATDPIRAGKVQLNHMACEDVAEEIAAGDVISLRGSGRIRILSIEGNSKSGRTFVRIGKYI